MVLHTFMSKHTLIHATLNKAYEIRKKKLQVAAITESLVYFTEFRLFSLRWKQSTGNWGYLSASQTITKKKEQREKELNPVSLVSHPFTPAKHCWLQDFQISLQLFTGFYSVATCELQPGIAASEENTSLPPAAKTPTNLTMHIHIWNK